MDGKADVLSIIQSAFSHNVYPGDNFLQGSFEGGEPLEAIEPFMGQDVWKNIDPKLLDAHYDALNFFSEAALRYFLPAYLVADLGEKLQTANPLFILVHGFSDISVTHQIATATFTRKSGRSRLLNPQRFGAMTFYDYDRWRLSIFSREEAGAIAAYLEYKRDTNPDSPMTPQIEAALELYWLERAENAPSAAQLQRHLDEEKRYLAALGVDLGD